MTLDEAIARGREIAQKNGWSWYEPAGAVRARAGFFGRGRWLIHVLSRQPDVRGSHVSVVFDEETGEVVRAVHGPR